MRRYRFVILCAIALISAFMVACETRDEPVPDNPTPEQPTPEEPTPDDPVEERPTIEENYIEFGNVRRQLSSGLYTINDLGEDKQYIFAMSPTKHLATYDEIIDSGHYVFLSIDESTLLEAIGNNSGWVDVMALDETNDIYMFIVKIVKSTLEDYAYDHSAITQGDIRFWLDYTTNDIVLQAEYTTTSKQTIKLEALLRYVAPEKPDIAGYIRYEWAGDDYNYPLATAYAYEDDNATTYTLCRDNVKTFVSTEDTITLSITIEGRAIGEDFTIDLASTTEEYHLTLYDPINGLPTHTITTAEREGVVGTIALEQGDVSCSLEIAEGELQSLEAYLGVDEFRTLNECTKVVYDEYSALFTPTAVTLNNSGENFIIEVVGEGHTFTIEYPAEGWNTLLTRNFISGSHYPTMSITLDGTRYIKGEGACYGMNAQFKAIDLDRGTLTLNANLYTEEGGVALYYDGSFELVQ